MLLYAILVWPTKFENSLRFMQNMFAVWEFKDNWLKILIFEKFGFKTSVFEEHFISYLCILFIKYYTLRSFYIKLLCFSKNCVFQIFDWSNRSKMRLKFWFESDNFDRCSIGSGSIKGIFDRLNLVFDQSKIA